jgi:hypothetical protein
MKNVFILYCIVTLISCVTHEQHSANQFKTPQDIEFKEFLTHFKCYELPINLNTNKISHLGLKEFDRRNSTFADEYSLAFKQIPSNGNYIATITLKKGENYLPVLTTYELTGEIIDRKVLALRFGTSCFENYCQEYLTINTDFSIRITDSIYTSIYDGANLDSSKTEENITIFKTGRILENGLIELSEISSDSTSNEFMD